MRDAAEYDVGVVGAGAWGTTLASHLIAGGYRTLLWAYETEVVEEINAAQRNSIYLPGAKLPEALRATNDLADFAAISRLIVAVPSQFFAGTLKDLVPSVDRNAWVVSATKGFVGSDLLRPSRLLAKELPENAVGVLSGPNLAREIIQGLPAISLVASTNEDLVKEYQLLLSTERFRVYGGRDVAGTELGGALKNIIAIAAGVSDGLRLGQNALAALITRGLAEMIRLGLRLGADERTFYGVSGLGDLVCTSQSALSRNHEVGRRIAGGEKLKDILKTMRAIAEGVQTTKHVHEYAVRESLDLPITQAVHEILFEDADPGASIRGLMTRSLKME